MQLHIVDVAVDAVVDAVEDRADTAPAVSDIAPAVPKADIPPDGGSLFGKFDHRKSNSFQSHLPFVIANFRYRC